MTEAGRQERYHLWLLKCWRLMIESLGWGEPNHEESTVSGPKPETAYPGES